MKIAVPTGLQSGERRVSMRSGAATLGRRADVLEVQKPSPAEVGMLREEAVSVSLLQASTRPEPMEWN